jgi:hypothetical protein
LDPGSRSQLSHVKHLSDLFNPTKY